MFKRKQKAMQMLWSANEAAALTGGVNTREWMASGVSISIDDLQPGDLFFAARGDDLEKVFARGAAAVVLPPLMSAHEDWPCLKVENSFEALRSFAQAARFRTHARVVAVQGGRERRAVSRALAQEYDVHEGGRHLSLGLASMPEDARYGVFGFSPEAAPDIAVVTDPLKAVHSRVFAAMPPGGTVLIDEGADGFVECLSAVKAAGVAHVIPFGSGRVSGLERGAQLIVEALDALRQSNVMRFEPETFAALKVKNIIDFGFSKKTLVLDGASVGAEGGDVSLMKGLDIPRSIDSLNLVYTSSRLSFSPSLQTSLQKVGGAPLQDVVPDVLVPGDFVVLKKPASQTKVKFQNAFRAGGAL